MEDDDEERPPNSTAQESSNKTIVTEKWTDVSPKLKIIDRYKTPRPGQALTLLVLLLSMACIAHSSYMTSCKFMKASVMFAGRPFEFLQCETLVDRTH